ncbi:hypothetical protein DRP04_08405 [Archaeoglobales archaeon]|nr:MAG: hypothetical protein DRP04_08405 [Archaeoglobales archaeon]
MAGGESGKGMYEKAGKVAEVLREFDTLRGRFWGHYGQARVCARRIALRKEKLEREGENMSAVERMRLMVEIHDLEARKRRHEQGLEQTMEDIARLAKRIGEGLFASEREEGR